MLGLGVAMQAAAYVQQHHGLTMHASESSLLLASKVSTYYGAVTDAAV
jgi:hypothetical protein